MNKKTSKLIFFIAAVLWGSSYAIQKPLLEFIDPVVFTFWNFFLSGMLFFGYAVWKKIPLTYRWREGIVLGIFVSGMEILEMVGLKLTSSANTVFLTNLGMLIIPYVGWIFYKGKVKVEDGIAIAIAIVGMYMLVGGVHGFGLGEGILLLSALSSAFYFIYSERYEAERARHITTLCIQQFFVVSLICLIWGLWTGTSFTVESGLRVTLLWQVILFTAIPYAIIQWASRYADEMIAAVYDGVVEPLTGAVLSWVIFMDATTPSKVVGGILMILSFIFAALFSRRHFVKHIFMKLDKGVLDEIRSVEKNI
jgi:drug/metabolite transporter (DMT)-like permease